MISNTADSSLNFVMYVWLEQIRMVTPSCSSWIERTKTVVVGVCTS